MAIFFDDVQGDVASVFISYFQRAPEFEAMQWYVGVLEGLQADPATQDNAFNLLAAHIYADGVAAGEVPAGPTVTDAWYVSYLYGNILGRAPEPEGIEYWTTQLQNGTIARAELVGTFVASALASEGRDAAYLSHRTQVAVEFAQWENSNPQVLPTLKYNAAQVLLGVNENPATVAAAQERLESHTGPIGESWNLTTGIDTLEGTSGNDTFNAVFDSRPGDQGSTLTAFDSIDGGLGTDTLNIYVRDAATNGAFPVTARVQNVEIVKVFNGGAVAEAPGAGFSYLNTISHYGGVQQFWQIDTASEVAAAHEGMVVGFANVQDLGVLVGMTETAATANIELAGVGRDDDIAVMAVGPEHELTVAGQALTAVNLAGFLNPGADPLTLLVKAGKGVRELTVASEVDIDVCVEAADADKATINRLDFSGSAGNVRFWIDADNVDEVDAEALTVLLGAGDDVIVFESRDLTLRDAIDGGEGYDTVGLMLDGKLQTQSYDAINRLQNIDRLAFGGHDVEVDAAELAGFDLEFSGSGSVVVSNLANGQAFTVASVDCGCEHPYFVTLQNAATDVTVELDDVIFALQVGATVGGKGGALTLEGDGGLLFDNWTSGKFSTIDASGLEGYSLGFDLDFVGSFELNGLGDIEDIAIGLVLASLTIDPDDEEAGIVFNGSGMNGGVAETILLNTAALDVILLNIDLHEAGEDSIAWNTSNSSTYGRMDVIEGFNSDADAGPLDYLVAPGSLGKLSLSASDDTLQLAFQAAAASYGQGDLAEYAALYFVFDGNTYVYADTGSDVGVKGQYDNADFALKIMGVHDLSAQWLTGLAA